MNDISISKIPTQYKGKDIIAVIQRGSISQVSFLIYNIDYNKEQLNTYAITLQDDVNWEYTFVNGQWDMIVKYNTDIIFFNKAEEIIFKLFLEKDKNEN